MAVLPKLWANRRRTAGAALVAGGALVLGLWTLLGWVVPILLIGIALGLAWRRSALGAAATVAAAVVLFWLGLALGWVAWVVGIALVAGGLVLLLARGYVADDGPET